MEQVSIEGLYTLCGPSSNLQQTHIRKCLVDGLVKQGVLFDLDFCLVYLGRVDLDMNSMLAVYVDASTS